MPTQYPENDNYQLLEEIERLKQMNLRLEEGIRTHRDANGDDRCWKDDELLYSLLPEGISSSRSFNLEEKQILMGRCERFWDTRKYPCNQGKIHEWGQVVRQGLYRHYKGKLYLVHGIAVHSETNDNLVVYRPLYGNFRLTVRPERMFLEEVDSPEYKYKGPRFQFISEMF